MANIKLKNNYWVTESIYDTTDSKTQKQVNADLHQDIEDTVIVSDTQPSSDANQIWLPQTIGEGVQVPTWAEHQALVDEISTEASARQLADSALNSAINDVEDNVTALQNKISSYSKNETITNKWEYAYGAISVSGTRLVVKVDLEKSIGNLTFTPTRVGLYLRDSDNNMVLGNNYDATSLITALERYNDYALSFRFENANTFGRTTNSFVVGQVILSGTFVE